MSPLPSNLEKVADAGGWDERAAERAAEFMEKASKIKEKEWKAMTGTLGALKEIVDAGGLEGVFDRITDTWELQVENALAPLTNEISQLIAEALGPILPAIEVLINEITNYMTLGWEAIEALLAGNFDNWLEDETTKFQSSMDGWSDDWKAFHTEIQKTRYLLEQYLGLLGAAGTAAVQDIETWGNDVNQWWYELWISLGWY